MDNMELVSEVRFTFEESKDFRYQPANGVWGGIGPTGSVNAAFFLDVAEEPLSVLMTQDDQGARETGRVETQDEDNRFRVRRIKVGGVVMTAREAEIVGAWFLRTAAMARQVEETSRDRATDSEAKDG